MLFVAFWAARGYFGLISNFPAGLLQCNLCGSTLAMLSANAILCGGSIANESVIPKAYVTCCNKILLAANILLIQHPDATDDDI